MSEEGGIRWLLEFVKNEWSESDEVIAETLESMGAPESVLSMLRTRPILTLSLHPDEALYVYKALDRFSHDGVGEQLQREIKGEYLNTTGQHLPEPWEWDD